MIRSLRGRLVAAMLGAVLLSVAVSLSLGVTLTRDALRDSIAKDLAREADHFVERFSQLPRSFSLRLARRPSREQLRRLRQGRGGARILARPGAGERSIPVPPPDAAPGGPGPGGPGPPDPGPPGAELPAGPSPEPRGAPELRIVSLDEAERILPSSAVDRLRAGDEADGRADIDDEDQLFSARPLRGMAVVLTRPAGLAEAGYGRYLTGLLLASGLAALVAALIATGLARRLSAPLRRIVAATRELSAGKAPGPLPRTKTAELDALSEGFEEMGTKLARAKEAERSVLLSVSHELRTPLTAIRGYAEGIEDGTVEPATAAEVVGREARRLERLVQDLLDLARLEQGVLDVRSERVDLLQTAREAEERLLPRAKEKGVEIRVESADDGGAAPSATADHDRTVQVLSNLVENAVRATPAGGTVTIEAGPGRLSVADTGAGIAAEHLPHAFERFHLHQRDDGVASEGSGLGLAIVRELTEAMGGSVAVESEAGRGSVFSVTLPRAP